MRSLRVELTDTLAYWTVVAGAKALAMFVAMLRTAPVTRPGSGQGRVRGPARINHLLAAVREFYKHSVADGVLDA